VVTNGGPLLQHCAHLAAVVTQTASALLLVRGGRKDQEPRHVAIGLSQQQVSVLQDLERSLAPDQDMVVVPNVLSDNRFRWLVPAFDPPVRFLVFKRLVSSGREYAGFLYLLDTAARSDLTTEQRASLDQIANVIMADRQREQRHLHLMHVADRALRIDRMLRLVSEAASCEDALISLLEALCHLHGAAVGQIAQLTQSEKPLREISRYDRDVGFGEDRPVNDPLAGLDDLTIEAIRNNEPRAIDFSKSDPAKPLAAQGIRGLTGYVCLPFWLHQQRFGIVLAFTAETAELDTVAANIASLGDSIRPALFQKITEERIRHAAYHDSLTQLSNRLMFHERLRTAIATARSGGSGFAILCLDLDGFKRVNDTFGHGDGDSLLAGIAQRLRELTKESDTVARTGGDEFAIILPASRPADEAVVLAKRLLDAVPQPFELSGQKLAVGVSIGIAVFGEHGDNPDLLMRRADQALYRSKQSGRNNCCVYDPAMDAADEEERFIIERDLKDAISNGDLTLAYQPVCDSMSQSIVSFEALLRWQHPTLGWVPPDKCIPIAEKSGLIIPLGQWVLETACTEAMRWDRPVSVAVNLSPLQFRQPDLPERIAEVLDRTGLPGERLILEVTEGLLLDQSDLVIHTMQTLRAMAIRVVLDDFGTAYASMSYLRRFPFDGIKIDKSFIRGLHNDNATLAIVETILLLASRLNLAVVAEGVESDRELGLLRRLGCRLVQGYLVGRPLARHRARSLLRQSLANDVSIDFGVDRRTSRPEQPLPIAARGTAPLHHVAAEGIS
jgi:diguanylate cyclase (GGDEF)-like protein